MKVSVIIPVWNQEKLIVNALESIPERDDIETIVVDDGSTDGTRNAVRDYMASHLDKNIRLLGHKGNKGVSCASNKGLANATGEYVVMIGSDDYFLTDTFLKALDLLDGTDLVYFDIRINDGSLFRLTEETKNIYCGSTKFMRRAFIDGMRYPEEKKAGEDWYFNNELQARKPTEVFSGLVVKHYNFPREGSLVDLRRKGIITEV